MRQLPVLTFIVFSCALFPLSDSADYFQYKRKFRACAVLESKHGSRTSGEIEEIIPPGYTFYTRISSNTSRILKEIKEQCKIKRCLDGPFQKDCQGLGEGDVISFDNTENVSLVCTCTTSVPDIFQNLDFDRKVTGVVFSPYVKNWYGSKDGSIVSKWNNYTMAEVKRLISVLATQFSHFSTYGMGATSASRSWDEGDSTGLVPVAAAEVNKILKAKGMRTVTVSQGIFQNEYPDIQEQEIRNALSAAEDANRIFNGTVTGIIFTSDYVSNEDTGNLVCRIIDEHKIKTEAMGLKIGVRLRSCTDIIPIKLPEADNNLHSVPANYTYTEFQTTELKSIFTKLLERVNFIICTHFPPAFLVNQAMEDVVRDYGQSFLKIQRILKAVNPNVTVVGQAGWASWGVSSNGASNNLANLVEFWNQMNSWAVENEFPVELFEAFDEPWKTDVNDKSNSGPNGQTGAEGNYGWWKRQESETGDFYTYVPKVEELESLTNVDDLLDTSPIGVGSITVAFVIVIAVVLGVTAFLIWRLRRSTGNKAAMRIALEFRNGATVTGGTTEKERATSDKPTAEVEGKSFVYALRFPYDRKYELSKKTFKIDENCVLGQGNYGVVYKGSIEGIPGGVAFKTLNSNGSIIELKNLLSEIKIMAFVGEHEHIVNLLGAYTAKIEQGIIYVGIEYCELGSLEAYLKAQRGTFHGNAQTSSTPVLSSSNYVVAYFAEADPIPSPFIVPQKILTPADLFKWGYQIAFGMEHIAKKKVIHSDLAARNVLLTADGTAKIADFGLSRQLYYQCEYLKSNTKEELPWRWLSLESLRSLVFSVESDAWTFGITLWEIFSLAELPYPGVPGWTPSFLHELEVNNYRMDPPQYASDDIYDVMLKCWLSEPCRRPSFTELKETLHEKWKSILATPES